MKNSIKEYELVKTTLAQIIACNSCVFSDNCKARPRDLDESNGSCPATDGQHWIRIAGIYEIF